MQTADGPQQQPLEARFKGVVALPSEALAVLAPGEIGWVTVAGEERSLFGLALEAWRHWTGGILAAVGG